MIRVDRGAPLEGFTERAASWKNRMEEALRKNSKLTRSKYWSQVRNEITTDAQELFVRFRGKCAFCESHMAHVSRAHIEHYRPKSRAEFAELTFDWGNWLLSCGRCNDNKWAHFPYCEDYPCLINPTEDDPAKHITFVSSVALGRTPRGIETIRLLGLDRSPLEDERVIWLSFVRSLLLLCLIESAKPAARTMLIWSMQNDAPYSAMTRNFLQEHAPLLASAIHETVSLNNPVSQIEELISRYKEELRNLID